MSPEIVDILENLKQISNAMVSITDSKKTKSLTQEEFDKLHQEEFRLSMEQSSLRRKIEKQLRVLQQDPSQIFVVNRIKKSLEKV